MKYDNSGVRRQDRLLDERSAAELLRNGEYGVLSMTDGDGGVYGIPVNYVWDGGGRIYIHCAPEGRKLRCIAANPKVSFCVIGRTNVLSSQFTTEYESLVVNGIASIGLSENERREALGLIVDKYSPRDRQLGKVYIEKSFNRTEIIRIDMGSWSGKRKKTGK